VALRSEIAAALTRVGTIVPGVFTPPDAIFVKTAICPWNAIPLSLGTSSRLLKNGR
jgi:hypothetical protein